MALIRANTQVLDGTLNWEKLESDFLDGQDLNLTNGNNNATLTGVKDPVNDRDVATKAYVDTLAQGLKSQDTARVRAQGDVASLSGLQTVDGVALQDGDQILLDQQSTSTEDGLYIVRSGTWERHPDWQTGEAVGARYVFIIEGTDDNKGFVCTNDTGSDIVGTDDLVFVQFSGAGTINAGAGMVQSGTYFNVQATDNSITVNADDLQVNIGNDNGTSLEVTSSGVELATTITGARTFNTGGSNFVVNAGAGNVDLTGGEIDFTDNEVSNATTTSAIPFAVRATVDYGNGNGTNNGDVIDQFRAEFTDEAVINALCELKADIDGSTLTVGNGLTNTSGVVSLGDQTTDSFEWLLNTGQMITIRNNSYVGANNDSIVTHFNSGTSSGTPYIYLAVETNSNNDSLGSIYLTDSQALLRYSDSTITIQDTLADGGTGGILGGGANNWSLDTAPDGTVSLAIATTGYVDSKFSTIDAGNGLTNNSGTIELGGTLTKTTTITDGRASGSQTGIEYAADYSADYSDRSLVDKEYVDTTIDNSIDATNGLTKDATSGKIKLGGSLIENTLVTGNLETLKFEQAPGMGSLSHMALLANSEVSIYSQNGSGNSTVHLKPWEVYTQSTDGTTTAKTTEYSDGTDAYVISSVDNSDILNRLIVQKSDISLNFDDTLGGSGTGQSSIVLNGSNITVTTSAANGMQYAADYSANNSTNDRWLPDKAYVDGLVTAQNGLTMTNHVVEMGGALTKNTSIQAGTYTFGLYGDSGAGQTGSLETLNGITIKAANANYNTNTQLVVGVQDITLSGHSTWTGAIYDQDYSANYVNRSLVDKEYVDNLVSSGVTASNGLTKVGADIQLGGTLSADTTIGVNGHELYIGGSSQTFYVEVGGLDSNNKRASFSVDTLNYTDGYVDMVTSDGADWTKLSMDGPADFEIRSTLSAFQGIRYYADYSTNFVNRSLVDKEYVDNQVTNGVTASNGLTKVGNDVQFGGTLSTDTTVDVNYNDFTIQGNNDQANYAENVYFGTASGGELSNFGLNLTQGFVANVGTTFTVAGATNFQIGTTQNSYRIGQSPDGSVDLAIATVKYVKDLATTRKYNNTTTLDIGNQTATLDTTPTNGFVNAVVYLNGVRQLLTTDYTVTNTSTGEITFTSNQPIQSGDVVIIDYNDQA